MTVLWESNLYITSMITDRVGRKYILLQINHNNCNFLKTKNSELFILFIYSNFRFTIKKTHAQSEVGLKQSIRLPKNNPPIITVYRNLQN